jgi:hypothetical protein
MTASAAQGLAYIGRQRGEFHSNCGVDFGEPFCAVSPSEVIAVELRRNGGCADLP